MSPNELLATGAASPTPRSAGISVCALIRRIWSRRLLTSIVVMTVFQRVIGLPSPDARPVPTGVRSTRLDGLRQTVLAQLLHQRGALDAKQLGRVGHDAIGRVQGLADQADLDTRKVILEVEAALRKHRRI